MKYITKPNIVEARQLTSDSNEMIEIIKWAKEGEQPTGIKAWIDPQTLQNSIEFRLVAGMVIEIGVGGWVIKGEDGIAYPMDNEDFVETFRKLDE
jgi:hypothetical protein